ncbi:hypothetical protein ADZ37_21910 [Pannonibacter phragmitetus]|uniref:Uncharacterized protein n=2 Tax=Pannonibacter phragmitetus TaxID=121719 RepID=A0A0L0IUK5_9HYPH|nr:hypothetical protein [Pannonibacter phragmitetus]ALV27941.1 hypothetical protein APZ00_13420 [Pannonibacter phragmitetus]KND16745.1 hypothetical protein ADZ37_21910 [Pannonibacter phragmitetus]MBA4203798.1 hypothetical protein [Polymorphum sp.]
MMKSFNFLAAAVAATLTATAPLMAAGTGQEGYFQIYNNTDSNTVVGFYTNGGDGWSDNWLSNRLAPGDNVRATFHANSGPCEQTFQVGWLGTDGSEVLDDPISIDICEASNVYLDDNEMYYD